MNNLECLFAEAKDVQEFAGGYFAYLCRLLRELDTGAIAVFIEELEKAYENQKTVFIAGNGGSAATASHMANDIGIDVFKKSQIDKPIRALALTDNAAVVTAIANDSGYENIFLNQLRILYQPGDVLVVISASGNSANLLNAAEWIKLRGGRVIGLLGFDGGKLKDICDLVIHCKTPIGEYGPVEDIHLILDHLISAWLQYKLRGRGSR